MLQVARLAPNLLREASERVVDFLQGQINEDGGVRDRAGRSDLYYTVFGLEGLIALRQEPPFQRICPYLERFGDGEGLDLVHLACLARCWAALPRKSLHPEISRRLAERLDSYRAGDGGYGPTPGEAQGTVYHGFLALGAHQDLGIPLPDPEGLVRSIQSLQLEGGGFAGQHGVPVASTPTTAAALTLLRQFHAPIPPGVSEWLLEQGPDQMEGFWPGWIPPYPIFSPRPQLSMHLRECRFRSNTSRNLRWIFWTHSGPAKEPSTGTGRMMLQTANIPITPCSHWAI